MWIQLKWMRIGLLFLCIYHCIAQNTTEHVMDYRNIRLISFTVCISDPICSQRFFIDSESFDMRTFKYFFDRFVIETKSKDFLEKNFYNDQVKKAWLYTMQTANFCTENEIVTTDGYCVCKSGKTCHEEYPTTFTVDIMSFNVIFVILLITTLYYSVIHLSDFRDIHDNIQKLQKHYKSI